MKKELLNTMQLLLMLTVFIINGVTVMDILETSSLEMMNKLKTSCEMALMAFSLLPLLKVSLRGVIRAGSKGFVVIKRVTSQPALCSLCVFLKTFSCSVRQKLCGSHDIPKRMSEEI